MYFESRGFRLHYRRWWVENALGVVVVSHGLGEHSGRYRAIARQLNAHGYSVYALDHFGHGQSPGRRGDIGDFSCYASDLRQFIRAVRHENPGLALHLLGHSMGAVIASDAVVYDEEGVSDEERVAIESLILSAPAFAGSNEPGAFEVSLIRLLARVCPGLSLSNRLQTEAISRDPDIVREYCADDLVHNRVTPRWFLGYREAREHILAHPQAIAVPTLTLLPEGDRLVDPAVTHQWHDRLQGEHHQLRTFAGAYHEILNEPGSGQEALAAVLEHLRLYTPVSTQQSPPQRLGAGA